MPLRAPETREANPGPLGADGAPGAELSGTGAWGEGGRRGCCGPAAPARLGDLGELSLRREQPQVLDEPLCERVRLGIALQLADRIGSADRVGLAEEVVAQADLGVGIGAADLAQRRAGPRAHLVGCDPEEGADVVIALPALEQELEHRALFVGERHGRGSVGQRRHA